MATSDSDEAEVECYSTVGSVTDVVEMPGCELFNLRFRRSLLTRVKSRPTPTTRSTECLKHFRYSILSLVRRSAIPGAHSPLITFDPTVWGFLLLLLALVLRQHSAGHRSMWYCAVTSYPWFGSGKGSSGQGKSKGKGKLPEPVTQSRSRSRGRQPNRERRFSVWASNSHKAPPARAHLATDKYDKFKRGASPRR